jgi:hypothetical protein
MTIRILMRLLLLGLLSVGVHAQCSLCQLSNYTVVSASSPNPDVNGLFASASPVEGFGAHVGYVCGLQYCAPKIVNHWQWLGWSCTQGAAQGSVDVAATIGGRGAVSTYELTRGLSFLLFDSGQSDCSGNRTGEVWPFTNNC